MMISMIAAMAHDRVMGLDNQMPWHLPADLAHFKRVTLGKPVLMGRRPSVHRATAARPNRNLVISRNPDYRADGVEVIDSVGGRTGCWRAATCSGADGDRGGHLYGQLLPRADRLYRPVSIWRWRGIPVSRPSTRATGLHRA